MARVAIENHDGVWVLELGRPPVNAVELELAHDLNEALRAAETTPDCRALVMTGSHGVFSAGIDVRVVPGYDADGRHRLIRSVNDLVRRLYALPKPTIAAINGHALGGGLVIALSCDLRFASQGYYQLGLNEVFSGVPFPAAPLAVVEAELDPRSRRLMALRGSTFGPLDDLAAAFVDAVYPPKDLMQAALDRARAAARAPGYSAIKRQLRAATLVRLDAALAQDFDPLLEEGLDRAKAVTGT
ncbi:MAG TPA: enoyl-CoA hydratase/isomerase family protein [Thermoanaerobaculia bacterium]|nr:enoyl-CoA hydratase/isomerase family protein [Thermoanaerobaculia bacterium]